MKTLELPIVGRMPTDDPKRGPGRPAGVTPKTIIHTAIDIRVGRALRAYMKSLPYEVKLKSVTERAFRLLLEKEGWPIEGDDQPKKGRR